MKSTKPIPVYSDSSIFIACPAGVVTGGPELLHQLCSTLVSKGFRAFMYYFGDSPIRTPAEYQKYNCPVADSVADLPRNILIVPEVKTTLLYEYREIRKVIWWLSVDNYPFKPATSLKGKIKDVLPFLKKTSRRHFSFNAFDPKVIHLVQSYYAENFIKNKAGVVPLYLSDFLNEVYFLEKDSNFTSSDTRGNIVLYNPKKGFEIVKRLIDLLPTLTWTPLTNMTPQQMRETMLHAKLYVDFGPHPGKDRIPREAAMQGCCVITGLRGSARYSKDVSIPQQYKLDDATDIAKIAEKVEFVVNNYDKVIPDFQNYRDLISAEHERFIDDIDRIFLKK